MPPSKSTKVIHVRKSKAHPVVLAKNQTGSPSPPASSPAHGTILPRIDRRGNQQIQVSYGANHTPRPPSSRNSTLSSEATNFQSETSPTYHGDDHVGPPAKAAWCTPRTPPSGSCPSSFLALSSGGDGPDTITRTPTRLRSIEEILMASEEVNRVDLEVLSAGNNKFFEISAAAAQHVDDIQNELPHITEAFLKTRSALHDISADIVSLHDQQNQEKSKMLQQLEEMFNQSTADKIALVDSHLIEKSQMMVSHEQELQEADVRFRQQLAELEDKYKTMEEIYEKEIQQLQESTSRQIEQLQLSAEAEKMELLRSSQAEIKAVQKALSEELEMLRSSSTAEFQQLQQSSRSTLQEVTETLTTEITLLKQGSSVEIARLTDEFTQKMQRVQDQSDEQVRQLKEEYANERFRLVHQASQEIARLQMEGEEQLMRKELHMQSKTNALQHELEAMQADYRQQILELHRSYTAQIDTVQTTMDTSVAALRESHTVEVANLLQKSSSKLSETIVSYENRLASMAEEHALEITQLNAEATETREGLVRKYEQALAMLQEEGDRGKDGLKLKYETELEILKRSTREHLDKTTKNHENYVLQLREVHSSRILTLEAAVRDYEKRFADTMREKDDELEVRQARIDDLESIEFHLKQDIYNLSERSSEALERKQMAVSEQEARILCLEQERMERNQLIDELRQELNATIDDRQVKANTILELTFVIKSRDEEIDKLRNSLLDSIQNVNTKTEILEMTTETLSSKAKELEDTKAALRLESAHLLMVEESMHQKEGLLENTELKIESMRLNMENMRLEMKRIQLDMKLQLEHTEGEMELKNGEIRRLHGAQSELKQKNDFAQQTIVRLEETLAATQRQSEELQRRVELLKVEAVQNVEEAKTTHDQLLERDQTILILTKEKQVACAEKQRLQIQLNNLNIMVHNLREKVEREMMRCEEVCSLCQRLLEETTAEKDERLRSEKQLLVLELSAIKEILRQRDGVEARLSESKQQIEHYRKANLELSGEIDALKHTLQQYDGIDTTLKEQNYAMEILRTSLQRHEETSRTDICLLEMRKEEMEQRLIHLWFENEKKLRDIDVLQADVVRTAAENVKLVNELTEEKTKISINLQAIKNLQTELVEAKNELKVSQLEGDETSRQLILAQQQLLDCKIQLHQSDSAFEEFRQLYVDMQVQTTLIEILHQIESNEHTQAMNQVNAELMEKSNAYASPIRSFKHIQQHQVEEQLELVREAWETCGLLRGDYESRLREQDANNEADFQRHHATHEQLLQEITFARLENDNIRKEYEDHLAITKSEQERLLRSHEEEKLALAEDAQSKMAATVKHVQMQAELDRLQVVEDHTKKFEDLMESARIRDHQQSADLNLVQAELMDRESKLHDSERCIYDMKQQLELLNNRIENQEHELNNSKQEIMAKTATIESIRKGKGKTFVALLRQQLDTYLWEVYRIDRAKIENFKLEDEEDLLQSLKHYFAMRCRPNFTSAKSREYLVLDVEEVCGILQDYDRIIVAIGEGRELAHPYNASEDVAHVCQAYALLKDQLEQLFRLGNDSNEVANEAIVNALDYHRELFDKLALTNASDPQARSKEIIQLLNEQEHVMSIARSSSERDYVNTIGDIEAVFSRLDSTLTLARQVTESDRIQKLEDLIPLLEECERLRKGFSEPKTVAKVDHTATAASTDLLKSTEILSFVHTFNQFIASCTDVLHMGLSEVSTADLLEAIRELVKILDAFELFQPQFGNPHSRKTQSNGSEDSHINAELMSSIHDKVGVVLAFVEELRLLSSFAQNILDEEAAVGTETPSNSSSSASLATLRALTRTSTPTVSLTEDLRIDIPLPTNESQVEQDQRELAELADNSQEYFSDTVASAPTTFLADSLIDISLVMNDHHRIISETAHLVGKASGMRKRECGPLDLGTEISQLIREHCALLSLAKRLFNLNDPRQDMASLLECLAILMRLTEKLSFSQSTNGFHSCESTESIHITDELGTVSSSSLSHSNTSLHTAVSVFTSIESLARHLQDYDDFVQSMKEHVPSERVSNLEALASYIVGRLELVTQAQSTLGLKDPIVELPEVITAILKTVTQMQNCKSWVIAPEPVADEDDRRNEQLVGGISSIISKLEEMPQKLENYATFVIWVKEMLPFSDSVQSIDELKERLKESLMQLEKLANATVTMNDEIDALKQRQLDMVEEKTREDKFLIEFAQIFDASSGATSPQMRLETLNLLLEHYRVSQQKQSNDQVNLANEKQFLNDRGIMWIMGNSELPGSSPPSRIKIYEQLLHNAEQLCENKRNLEMSLSEAQQRTYEAQYVSQNMLKVVKQEADIAMLAEQEFLASHGVSVNKDQIANGTFSRINVYEQLLAEKSQFMDQGREYQCQIDSETAFLLENKLVDTIETPVDAAVIKSIRLKLFHELIELKHQLRKGKEQLDLEASYLTSNGLSFDTNSPFLSRMDVYRTLLDAQNALIEEKMERKMEFAKEKAYLESSGIEIENRLEILERYVSARDQLKQKLEEEQHEKSFLIENSIKTSEELEDHAFRMSIYRMLVDAKAQSKQMQQQLEARVEEERRQLVNCEEASIATITHRLESMERILMEWNEHSQVTSSMCQHIEQHCSQQIQEAIQCVDEERSTIKQKYALEIESLRKSFEDEHSRTVERHASDLTMLTQQYENEAATVAERHARELAALVESGKEQLAQSEESHIQATAAALEKQAKQLEFLAFVHAEEDKSTRECSALCQDQTRALLLDQFTKRDTAAISMIYRSIRLATDILNTSAFSSRGLEIPVDVNQGVVNCVKELKALKEFLIQSLEQITKDQIFPTHPPFVKLQLEEATKAGDQQCAIDYALASHREFMSFAHLQLLDREAKTSQSIAALCRVLNAVACEGAFTGDETKLMELEMELVRTREAQQTTKCQLMLCEEHSRRLVDEHKDLERTLTKTLNELRQESKLLRAKIDTLEQERYIQPAREDGVAFSPTNISRGATPMSPTGNAVAPIRPERPRDPSTRAKPSGTIHKERFVSDLERETGQRCSTNTVSPRHVNEWKPQEIMTSSSYLEREFRAMEVASPRPHVPSVTPSFSGSSDDASHKRPQPSPHDQAVWYQGVRIIRHYSFFVSVFHIAKQKMFRVEVFNSDSEQQQTVYVTWSEMQSFVDESKTAIKYGLKLDDLSKRAELIDVLFERVKLYGEGTAHVLLGFE